MASGHRHLCDAVVREGSALHLDAQYKLRLGAHALALGSQFKEESLRDVGRDATGRELLTLTDHSYRNAGLFVQDEWALDPDIDLVLERQKRRSMRFNPCLCCNRQHRGLRIYTG